MSENNRALQSQIVSEVELLEILNVEKRTLDVLRLEKGFPFLRLNSKCRVYLVEDVVDWLKKQRALL